MPAQAVSSPLLPPLAGGPHLGWCLNHYVLLRVFWSGIWKLLLGAEASWERHRLWLMRNERKHNAPWKWLVLPSTTAHTFLICHCGSVEVGHCAWCTERRCDLGKMLFNLFVALLKCCEERCGCGRVLSWLQAPVVIERISVCFFF